MKKHLYLVALLVLGAPAARAQSLALPPDTVHVSDAAARTRFLADTLYARAHYNKLEYRIPMRDGVKLHTVVYVPKDADRVHYPILLNRTPYSAGPYGPGPYAWRGLTTVIHSVSPNSTMLHEGYIFALQDVRGAFLSEGVFEDVRPEKDQYRGKQDIDESTDTFDTIEYLLKKGPKNNGRVGQWGVSYPGFYTTVGLLSRHPALKAASPQAPVTDWFWDDDHHNGAFFLAEQIYFWELFGQPRPQLTAKWHEGMKIIGNDGYAFYQRLGPLKNVNTQLFHGRVKHWNDLTAHPNYDAFWQARNPRPHLHDLKTAVLTVGGFNDAEDLFGALHTYAAIEQQNPGLANRLVMGPWVHGGWAHAYTGEMVGNVNYGPSPSRWYQQYVEAPFFKAYLKDDKPTAAAQLPEAIVFESGTNQWRTFDAWPPKAVQERTLYFQPGGKIGFEKPGTVTGFGFRQFLSDPAHPVPYTEATAPAMTREYMTDDQRFASRRPDVLTYQTDVLTSPLTLAGPIQALLQVATTGTDADWVVKIIDVYPDDTPDNPRNLPNVHLGGYQQMVRSEVMRGRFRNSFERPEPFVAGQVTAVPFTVQDLMHTFRKGHRLMVQVQSTWFPLVDRNPQKYVPNIFEADATDFQSATHRLYHAPGQASQLVVKVLP
ncbi:CocE/NonD family hydrolase [Hymenobacter sp. PAMC 26628]|uniref:CocE/NonD family hydrolase n=1 Tax=Hymenobacter sp. PAMC 26628 TaxID=1484118 RepID=UPI00077051DF|nr:CocE/NonD family hydrolase [Hymenobacter sp. PAMC 26628]AMJ64921.1 X-Pro dipeptidyl-peptidase [Hymenobacter sp. PAMC 26628]